MLKHTDKFQPEQDKRGLQGNQIDQKEVPPEDKCDQRRKGGNTDTGGRRDEPPDAVLCKALQ